MKVNIQLPSFHGFYDSIWSNVVYDNFYEDARERGITKVDEWSCDCAKYEKEVVDMYVDEYLELVNLYLDLNIEKCGEPEIVSPKYYNFETDRIFVDVSFSAMRKLRVLMRKWEKEMRETIKENHTSCDGFISFMSNDFDEWISEELKYDNDRFGLYLSYALCYLLRLELQSWHRGAEIEDEIFDKIYGNVYPEWYPDSDEAKEELEKIELVEKYCGGYGSYNAEKYEKIPLEDLKRKLEEAEFDRKYQLKINFDE